jgi:hypothetical protein
MLDPRRIIWISLGLLRFPPKLYDNFIENRRKISSPENSYGAKTVNTVISRICGSGCTGCFTDTQNAGQGPFYLSLHGKG